MELKNCISAIILFGLAAQCLAWGSSDKVKLTDIQVLTLYTGKMTTGRRSSPVPQLNCIGGTASSSFIPQVVQCYNRGSDGMDVQWECKSDMDNAYRFGKVEVVCEGYDYPDDPYILKGSCGLEYTIDLTKEGQQTNQQHSHNYYGDNTGNSKSYGWNIPTQTKSRSSYFETFLFLTVVGIVVYAIYKTCIAPNIINEQRSHTSSDYPDDRGPRTNPPSYGFRSNYFSGSSDTGFGSDSCGAQRRHGGGASNFWSGAATGGLLGYMFGSRNNNQGYGGSTYTGTSYRPATNTGWFGGSSSGFGSGGSSFSSGSSSSSSGTRTASGFGGTRRR